MIAVCIVRNSFCSKWSRVPLSLQKGPRDAGRAQRCTTAGRRGTFPDVCVSIAVSLDLTKQFGVSIEVATGPHERVAGLHYDSVFAMSPFLQFADEIDANQ
jgi:hypothetical protein